MADHGPGRDKDVPKKQGGASARKSTAVSLSGIKHPGQNDVMFGRGGDTNYHIGNHRFRLLADDYCRQYHEASRKEKSVIVQQLVSSWRGRDPPGRFLARTDPSMGEESLWHDVGNPTALKKAAKILSERSSEFRTAPSSRKRKTEPQAQPTDAQRLKSPPKGQVGHDHAAAAAYVEGLSAQASAGALGVQPNPDLQQVQPNPGPMMGRQASYHTAPSAGYPAGYLGGAEHLRHSFAGGAVAASPLTLSGNDQRNQTHGGLTQSNLPAAATAAAQRPRIDGGESSATPRGQGSGEAVAPRAANQDGADDESPESIAQDSLIPVTANLPSAAWLAGVFTSSSSDDPANNSSPSTDES